MSDKTLMIFAARTSVDYEDPKFGLKTYLEPLVEKRLDYGIFKNMNALVREVNIKMEDSNYQVFSSAPEKLVYT